MADFMGMMKQAQQLQEKMQSLQEEIAAMEATGTAGAGLVTVVVDGKPLGCGSAMLWDPIFSDDGEKLLLRYVGTGKDAGKFMRQVVDLRSAL